MTGELQQPKETGYNTGRLETSDSDIRREHVAESPDYEKIAMENGALRDQLALCREVYKTLRLLQWGKPPSDDMDAAVKRLGELTDVTPTD